MMGNGGYFGKNRTTKKCAAYPSFKKNILSGSCLLKDEFKLLFASNKVVLSKYESFVGKGYECRVMFRFSLKDSVIML